MYNETISTIIGFVAMLFAMSSYFVKNKSLFFIAQAGAILALAFSCLFLVQYYAVASYFLALLRVGVFYLYEWKGKKVPSITVALFAFLYIVFYFIINVAILNQFNKLDVILLIANMLFTVAFSIRNLMLLRYVFLIPLTMTLIYFCLMPGSSLFVKISYAFEILASSVAIVINSRFIYHLIENKKGKKNNL